MRWRYGLEPAEIAEIRGEPPGTVRSTLSRALERLRRSLRTVPALLMWPRRGRCERGLDVVREELLEKVRQRAARASRGARASRSAGAAGGALATGKLLVGLAASAVVAAGIAGALLADDEEASPGAAAAGDSGAPAAGAARRRSDVDGAAAAAGGTPVSVPARRGLRVVDASTGEPIAGALVLRDAARPSDTLSTDVEGFAALEPTGEEQVLARGYVGAAPAGPAVDGVVTATLWPIGLEMHQWSYSGRVVAADGAGVAGALVLARGLDAGWYAARTDDSGRFVVGIPASAALLMVSCGSRGSALATVQSSFVSGRPTHEDVTLRIGGDLALPVVLRGTDAALEDTYRLVVTPLLAVGSGAGVRIHNVADGAAVALSVGVWTLDLRRADDDARAAASLAVYVDGSSVRLPDQLRSELRIGYAVPSGPPLEALEFDVQARALLVHVDEATHGTPAAGVRVVLEDPAAADAAEPSFRESTDETYSNVGVTRWVGEPRRALPHRRVEAVTDARGDARFSGWVPLPAVVSVDAPFAVPRHELVDAARAGGGRLDLSVETGGRVDVRATYDVVLERLDVPATLLVTARRPSVVVPAGRYRLRRVRMPGERTDDLALAEPFEVEPSQQVAFEFPPARAVAVDVLAMPRLAAGRPTSARVSFGWAKDRPFRALQDGAARFEIFGAFSVTQTRRYEIAWIDGPCSHVHEVNVAGGEDATEPAVLRHDLDYDGGSIALRAEGLEPGTAIVLHGHRFTGVGPVVTRDAPVGKDAGGRPPESVERHVVRIPAEAFADGPVRVEDLPPGEYVPAVKGPTRRTLANTPIVVSRGASSARLVAEDLTLDVRTVDARESQKPALDLVRLVPLDQTLPASGLACSKSDGWDGRCATFRRVPAGNWRVEVCAWGEPDRRGSVTYMNHVVVYEEEIVLDGSQRAIEVRVEDR